ncbi:MAG: hypothetical protein ACJ71N_14805 [Terriglobales bacterium]|jgi:hypothetical protein
MSRPALIMKMVLSLTLVPAVVQAQQLKPAPSDLISKAATTLREIYRDRLGQNETLNVTYTVNDPNFSWEGRSYPYTVLVTAEEYCGSSILGLKKTCEQKTHADSGQPFLRVGLKFRWGKTGFVLTDFNAGGSGLHDTQLNSLRRETKKTDPSALKSLVDEKLGSMGARFGPSTQKNFNKIIPLRALRNLVGPFSIVQTTFDYDAVEWSVFATHGSSGYLFSFEPIGGGLTKIHSF